MPCAASDPEWVRCCASPISLSDSTGNTHGIRFRIRPPRSAAPSAAISDIVAAGLTVGVAPTAATVPATSGSVDGSRSSRRAAGPPFATSTPSRDFASAFTGWAAVRYSSTASPSRFSTCGAAGSMRPSCSGKNSSRLAVLPAGSARLSLIRLPSIVPWPVAPASGCGTSARVASNSATWADGPAVGLTGSVSAMSLSPGMQTSLHSSHSALPASVTRLPTGRSAGTWIVVSSRISPS